MIAFVVWTPLHIINSLNTYQTYYADQKADIYIYDEFSNADTIAEKLEELNVFNRVYLVNHKKIGNTIERHINILLNRNIFFKDKPKSYTDIFIQGGNYFSKILFGQTKKSNNGVRLNYIEDGVAAYLGIPFFGTSKSKQRLMNMINKYSMFNQNIDKYYVYEPNSAPFPIEDSLKLPKIEKNSDLANILKQIFEVDKFSLENLDGKVIFIDQPIASDGYSFDEKDILTDVIDTSDRQVIVKLHPRSEFDKYSTENISILRTDLPFELLPLANDFENVKIVSPFSTVSFSMSIMFGMSQPAIVLSKYIENKYKNKLDERTLSVIKKFSVFSESFAQQNSIISLPSNKETLMESLK